MDKIDLKILRLLQQRTELSRQIGETKRRHRAVIYVPERERALMTRLVNQANGMLPERAVRSIYREIISSSRAAQGQAPIGVLRSSAATVLLPGRWCFGDCDEFRSISGWSAMASSLEKGTLAVGLLSSEELADVLANPKGMASFLARFQIAGDFAVTATPGKKPLAGRIFIIMPRCDGVETEVNRLVILMECKSTVNAVKRLTHLMSARFTSIEQMSFHPRSAHPGSMALVRLALAKSLGGAEVINLLQAAAGKINLPVFLLGAYPGIESYGG